MEENEIDKRMYDEIKEIRALAGKLGTKDSKYNWSIWNAVLQLQGLVELKRKEIGQAKESV